jgi:hypothetical protein
MTQLPNPITLARLRAENRRLRQRHRVSRNQRTLERAHQVALLIVQEAATGGDISRRGMWRRLGLSPRQWDWGRAFLAQSSILPRHADQLPPGLEPRQIRAILDGCLDQWSRLDAPLDHLRTYR